ncbi:MAG: hydrogenase nickel incorporation protein HypB [Gammaproteobacteria bacterium]|nr:hydrogenase nickel incorporation protein HypB [Gammaproteobacteria bacterium]MCP5418396.1 hydrogenase nickel incorporation protein HypB [Chromatiaceae bacterium]
MCTVCGCGEGEIAIEGEAQQPDNQHQHHHHVHRHDHPHANHYTEGPVHTHAPGLSQSRMVQIEQDILSKNNEYAAANRRYFAHHAIVALNLVSSPGSGKTQLLTRTIAELKGEVQISVIEGDQQTTNDAERIRATGAKALQINTGKGCHLDGHMVGHALERLQPADGSLLFIENVGNLVCPAAFDLGEAHKVVILSVTEGEDKPIKYPDIFHASDLLILNKIDLLPYVEFDVERCIDYARRVNPRIRVLQLSARSGEGMQRWYSWLRATRQLVLIDHPEMAASA